MAKKSRSIKPASVKAAVVARSLSGQTKTKIAEDLGMTRNTVRQILSEAELNQFVQQGVSELYRIIPDAVNTYRGGVKDNVDRAESFLERVNVLPGKKESGSLTLNNFIGIGSLPRTDHTRKDILAESTPA